MNILFGLILGTISGLIISQFLSDRAEKQRITRICETILKPSADEHFMAMKGYHQ